MIIHATKKTVDRYNIKTVEMLKGISEETKKINSTEINNRMHEWGAKIFYFEKKKCIQIVHFTTKFSLILVDIKVSDLNHLSDLIIHYLLSIYADDKRMQVCILKMFSEHPEVVFTKLTDKRIISTLNRTQLDFLLDGYKLYDYIDSGVLVTMGLNRDINFKWLVSDTIGKKKDYYFAGEKFREVLFEYYG